MVVWDQDRPIFPRLLMAFGLPRPSIDHGRPDLGLAKRVGTCVCRISHHPQNGAVSRRFPTDFWTRWVDNVYYRQQDPLAMETQKYLTHAPEFDKLLEYQANGLLHA